MSTGIYEFTEAEGKHLNTVLSVSHLHLFLTLITRLYVFIIRLCWQTSGLCSILVCLG